MDHRTRLLDAAERLFYERGVRAVGVDEVRAASGVPLKRLYQCFPSKEELVVAYLRRRDQRWRASLAESVARRDDRVPAVFDWLENWFREPGFRGCAFVNSFGELGATSDAVARTAKEHKDALRHYLVDLVRGFAADPEELGEQLLLLVEGAITSAAVRGDFGAARRAREVAEILLARAGG
ncbi:TetR/AcrR family transcriptional regulator [Saccharothrix coeruleofusca]|uniref:TetR family transcriptional regulator n=2 Tax=Saccharothrix coeruleofusca TaxID=33919 RepID=A0A918AR00_9PSEU|nr:TetR/AcrR family transcriptional regulator [Saccharothrix coeruleofusca]GGP71667.1 TetR family transcriptional regulator [Saccharothrix coeruleofusca]